MNTYVLNLEDKESRFGFIPTLKVHILDKNDEGLRPLVIVCPGGAYSGRAENWEGERIAMSYIAAGFHAAILNYSVSPQTFPSAIKELAHSIKLCRQKADEWNIDSKRIIVCGFSAGGHLAASISSLWNCDTVFSKKEIQERLHRPDATILCYPVITSGDNAHKGSISNLLGSTDETTDLWKLMSLENQVDSDTPPAFLWHTFSDSAVPVENSMYYAMALRKNNVPFELHIYPNGDHGLSLCTKNIARTKSMFDRDYGWHKLSVDWICETLSIDN